MGAGHPFVEAFLRYLISIIAFIFATIAAATAGAPNDSGLAALKGYWVDAGIDVGEGQAVINGQPVRLQVLRTGAAVCDRIRRVFLGKFTVTENQSPFGVVLIAWDLKSEQCPSCRVWKDSSAMIDAATAITCVRASDASDGEIALVSPAGDIARTVNGQPRYEGEALDGVTRNWRLEQSAIYSFDAAKQMGLQARAEGAKVAAVEAQITARLTAAGYQPEAASAAQDGKEVGQMRDAKGTREALWRRGHAVFHYLLAPHNTGVAIQINETSVPESSTPHHRN